MSANDFSFPSLRPEYESLWAQVSKPGGVTKEAEARRQAFAIIAPRPKERFQNVELRTGVPWFVTGIILMREAGEIDFDAWLHNGDPMTDRRGNPIRTRDVPANRPPNPRCTWEDGAYDAYMCDGLLHQKDWSPAFLAFVLEKYNGFGYREFHHIPSPYLWGGTIVQKPGKYVRDRQFDPHVMDEQIGGMALLAALMQLDPSVKFEASVSA